MSENIPARNESPDQDELAQFIETLGPFDPPPDFRFEPEFGGTPPRPIPAELYQGRHCRGQRLAIVGSFVTGLIFLVCRVIPIVQTWGLYILPLQYLHWVGAVLVVYSGFAWTKYRRGGGPFVYVEEGRPLVARIVALFLRTKATYNGVPTVLEYVAWFQYRDPTSGEVLLAADAHDVSPSAKSRSTLSYHVGDYVTAVYLPASPAPSPRLYGLLDLRPKLGIVPKVESRDRTALGVTGNIVVAAAFFFALAWNVYAYGRFSPLEMSPRHCAVPLVLGAVLFGGMLVVAVWAQRKRKKALARANDEALAAGGVVELSTPKTRGFFGHGIVAGIFAVVGVALLGGLTMLCWAMTLNALCDVSPAAKRPVVIDNMWMKTHNYIVREYTIEYHFADDPAHKKRELLSTPSHMETFGPLPFGFAQIRQGFFGWPWVETIVPATPNNGGPAQP